MATEKENLLKIRLRYGMYALGIVSLLLVGGFLVPAEWLVAFKVLFGGIWGT